MTAISPPLNRAVVAELLGRFGSAVSPIEIQRQVDQATRDLRGSVAAESLPEMAIRLAIVRMDRRAGTPV